MPFIIICLANVATVVDTMKGADARALEAKIMQHKVEVESFAGTGFKLTPSSSESSGVPALSSREARLKAFGHLDAKQPSTSTVASESSTSTAGSSNSQNVSGTSISKMIIDDEADDEAIGV